MRKGKGFTWSVFRSLTLYSLFFLVHLPPSTSVRIFTSDNMIIPFTIRGTEEGRTNIFRKCLYMRERHSTTWSVALLLPFSGFSPIAQPHPNNLIQCLSTWLYSTPLSNKTKSREKNQPLFDPFIFETSIFSLLLMCFCCTLWSLHSNSSMISFLVKIAPPPTLPEGKSGYGTVNSYVNYS